MFSGQSQVGSNENEGHRRGRVVQGFTSSHHKDENGRSEAYFDESNDQGENFDVSGHGGTYGERDQASYNGARQDGQIQANGGRQQNQFQNEQSVDNANSAGGKFDASRFASGGAVASSDNGGGQESQQGYSQSNQFSKQQPIVS